MENGVTLKRGSRSMTVLNFVRLALIIGALGAMA